MKRLLIAMVVVAGMSLATSSAMAHGPQRGFHRHHGHHAHFRHHGHHHGYYRHPANFRDHRHFYHRVPVHYVAPVHPGFYGPPVLYRPAPAIGVHTRGISFGIGF